MYWADPQTGLSRALWGRAVGWLAMALADVVELLPFTNPRRTEVLAIAIRLGDALVGYRSPNGLWFQVLDQPGLEGNFEEVSASAMFAYFLLRTGRLAAQPRRFADAALTALDAIGRNHLARRGDGYVLTDICEVAGLGGFGGRERDGTAEYYVSEPTTVDDPKGVGPLMMAVAETMLLGPAAARPSP